MSDTSQALDKLHPSPFRRAVEQGRAGSVEVFVEVEAPSPLVQFDRTQRRQGFGSPRPLRIVPSDKELSTDSVRTAIENIVGAKALNPYGSKSTFVIAATPEQICRIAELDAVKEIWPNRQSEHFD